MKLNKKYFLVLLTALGIQGVFGVNLANAVPCESEILEEMQSIKENNAQLGQMTDPQVYFFGLNAVYFNSPDDFWPSMKKRIEQLRSNPGSETWPDNSSLRLQITGAKENIQKYGSNKLLRTGDSLVICYSQALLDANGDVNTILNRNSSSKNNNKSSNQPTNSGTSKQTNKKSNQQVVTDQPKQSNAGNLSKMSRSQLIDFAGSAADRGDYAQAYAAELQLAKDPDPEIARQALRRVGFRLREGQGVNRNFSEAHRILQQAASMGDVVAYSHLCKSYMDGIGVPENHTKALENCLIAAEKGDLTAQTNLGVMYEIGNGIQRSQKLSDQWTCKAAAQGEPTAVGNVKKQNIKCN